MFLSRRATQAEYFDAPDRADAEIGEFYESLASINRLFHFAEPFQRRLPKLVGPHACQSLSILDLGAGDGFLGTMLSEWATKKRGWKWEFTNLDANPAALRRARSGTNVVGSVLALPFSDSSFDVVIASQMTHHLVSDADIIRHFREAWRVARRGILFTDLHRNCFLYAALNLFFRLRRYPKHFRDDALISVRRGFRIGELRKLAAQAGIAGGRAWLYFGARTILEARKPGT